MTHRTARPLVALALGVLVAGAAGGVRPALAPSTAASPQLQRVTSTFDADGVAADAVHHAGDGHDHGAMPPVETAVDLRAEALARTEPLAARAARGERVDDQLRLRWPAQGGLTGWWHEQRRRLHLGIDIDGETGDPLVAAGPGVVTHAGPAPAGYGGYGNLVLIDHGDGVSTLYAHLDTVTVEAGRFLVAGDGIGTMGITGNVTGSHLHFEVRVGGVPVDPTPWLPARG